MAEDFEFTGPVVGPLGKEEAPEGAEGLRSPGELLCASHAAELSSLSLSLCISVSLYLSRYYLSIYLPHSLPLSLSLSCPSPEDKHPSSISDSALYGVKSCNVLTTSSILSSSCPLPMQQHRLASRTSNLSTTTSGKCLSSAKRSYSLRQLRFFILGMTSLEGLTASDILPVAIPSQRTVRLSPAACGSRGARQRPTPEL